MVINTYDDESEAPRSGRPSVIILGSGPNRIGHGVEFDYCRVQAALALRGKFEPTMGTFPLVTGPESGSGGTTARLDLWFYDPKYLGKNTVKFVGKIGSAEFTSSGDITVTPRRGAS